jgi:hypothetical protein
VLEQELTRMPPGSPLPSEKSSNYLFGASGILNNAPKNLPILYSTTGCTVEDSTLSKIEMSMDGAGFKHLALGVILSETFSRIKPVAKIFCA